MRNDKPIHPENSHPDLPREEKRQSEHPEMPATGRTERDYVAESTARGDEIYDESLFAEKKDPIPPSSERETALTSADTGVPATKKSEPEPWLYDASVEKRETPRQVLPGDHDLRDEKFADVSEHPNPLEETETEEAEPKGVDESPDTTGQEKNVGQLDKAIKDRAGEPEPVHPHMEDSQDHHEEVRRQKDKDMQDADVYNVFRRSKYRGDT